MKGSTVTFSLEGYHVLLQAIRENGYRTLRFDEIAIVEDGRSIYLRHDVDLSPRMALALGKAEAEHGMVSNLFFQINAETYNVFSLETLKIMQELSSLGHIVGLHIDQAVLGDDEDAILKTVEWFDRHVTKIDTVISFHRPDPRVLGRRYKRFLSAYDPQVFRKSHYLSDSRRELGFWPTLSQWMADGKSPIQLLLHPGWWGGQKDAAAVWQSLSSRRMSELAQYTLANFRKVFSGVVEYEDHDSGL